MRPWSWHGAVALVLAICVGVGWATALIIAAAQAEPIGQQGTALLSTIGGALVGGVVGWLGARIGFEDGTARHARRPSRADDETTEPPTGDEDTPTTEREPL